MTSPTPGLQAVYPLPPPGHPAGSAEPNQHQDSGQSGLKSRDGETRDWPRISQHVPPLHSGSHRRPARGGRELPPLPPCPLTKGFGDISWTRAASVLQREKSKERVSVSRGTLGQAVPLPWGDWVIRRGSPTHPQPRASPPPKKRPSESAPVPAFLSHCVWT